MSFLFGGKDSKKNAKEIVREQQREMKKGERSIDREQIAMQRQEKQLIADIKKAAKDGNEKGAKILAQQLVRLRQQTERMQVTKGQMKGISTQMQLAASQSTMVGAMAGASKAMGAVNASTDPVAMNKMLQDFQKQNEIMDAKQEMMDDGLDGLFDDDTIEEEADNLTNQVLEEIGLDMAGRMAAPAAGGRMAAPAEAEAEDDDLAARLANLKAPA